MRFRTEYEAKASPFTLDPSQPVVLAGSCFSQNISAKMNRQGWKAVTPAGTLYNPYSIYKAIDMMVDEDGGIEKFEKSLFNFNGIWNSHNFDSSFSAREKADCMREFEIRSKELVGTLEQGKTLVVTFGTSICYHLKEDGFPVGNCHKQPSSLFYTQRLEVSEILSCWREMLGAIQEKFPDLKTIFTVSPVRHLKNGMPGDKRSKAVLLLAVEEICRHSQDVFYFPAYEIMNDDLRDYRFYASDLVHPSDEAVEYIWEKFKDTFIDNEGRKILKSGEEKMKAALHRPRTGALGKTLESPPSPQ